jgi:hypothetical protein
MKNGSFEDEDGDSKIKTATLQTYMYNGMLKFYMDRTLSRCTNH